MPRRQRLFRALMFLSRVTRLCVIFYVWGFSLVGFIYVVRSFD